MKKKNTAALVQNPARSLVREWGAHEGRHRLDPLLEDVIMERELRRRGVEDGASVRVAVVANEDGDGDELLVMSTDEGALTRVVEALERGGLPVYARPVKRPNEEQIERLIAKDWMPPMLPVASAEETEDEDGEDEAGAPARRGSKQ